MAGNPLKVIALISGGKDSLFSILHCIEQEHEVIALANLYPKDNQGDDIDSYMYQTVGHKVVPLYEEALGLPLYQEAIAGTAVNTDKSYSAVAPWVSSSSEPDETESLLSLLKRVMNAHPNANAVSTGAILSDYQRTRVESVAVRLGLTSLSYLWHLPSLPPYRQTSLLEDIASVGQDSRIIKVASGGLDERQLWQSVTEARTIAKLINLMGRFGGLQIGVVLGEGGEYETLTIDGPAPIWKRRIEIEDDDRSVIIGGAGVSSTRIAKAITVRKDTISPEQTKHRPRIPSLLDIEFEKLMSRMCCTTPDSGLPEDSATFKAWNFQDMESHVWTDNGVFISNLIGVKHDTHDSTSDEQMESIMKRLLTNLGEVNLSPDNITFTTILLRSMSDFESINKIYASLFRRPNPPARVTVACGNTLPANIQVMLSVVIHPGALQERKGLHVQSISYWAPANIGPYSQAIAVPLFAGTQQYTDSKMVYVAGQIPLVPASMSIVSADFELQAVLSLQHLWRIGRVMQIDWWTNAVAYITALSREESWKRALIASEAWTRAHEHEAVVDEVGDDDEDISDSSLRRWWGSAPTARHGIATCRAPIPDWNRVKDLKSQDQKVHQMSPRCFVVEVDELPRGAQIEWSSLGLADIERVQISQGIYESSCSVEQQDVALRMTCVDVPDLAAMEGLLARFDSGNSESVGLVEVFTSHQVGNAFLEVAKAMIIPCRRIWSSRGEELYAAIRYRSN